jgi:hypothetical protein
VIYRHPELICPVCGYKQDATAFAGATDLDNHMPPGNDDRAICLACTSVNIFTLGGAALRLPTADERAEFALNPVIQRAVQAMISARDRSSSWPSATNQTR